MRFSKSALSYRVRKKYPLGIKSAEYVRRGKHTECSHKNQLSKLTISSQVISGSSLQ